MKLLEIQSLNKSFNGLSPVKDVAFVINPKTITLITGENGAGKTTLFNLISGLEKSTKGQICFEGKNIERASALKIAKLGITRLYQQPRLFKNLRVWENLVAAAHGLASDSLLQTIFRYTRVKNEDAVLKQKAIELLSKFGLHELGDSIAGELSYGQQKLISFCMIGMNGTKLALLDEPFAGLNPQTADQLCRIVEHMRDEGMTFIVIEHNINKALEIADRHIEMKNGRINVVNDLGLK
ncbi:MAG: ATP-binding cassette domain-containing protein [Chloracidobacterium sp.]|nr:ATP-binding cassette domain-containing protein [Chloracidobacterium sp.]